MFAIRSILASVLLLAGTSVSASVNCSGKINDVYKWHNMTSLSFRIKLDDGNVTNWINMPTKSDESMALMAFSTNSPVLVYWAPATVTSCVNGWDHNTPINGYFVITK